MRNELTQPYSLQKRAHLSRGPFKKRIHWCRFLGVCGSALGCLTADYRNRINRLGDL
jgi:hypothetical protein